MAEKKKKASAKKKLIPAVAMLATSAVMLSSATYAWFTLNKDVEVKGLQMAATAGDSLEITLGKLDKTTTDGSKNGGTPDNTTFGSVGDLGWDRTEAIDSYYKTIAKLKPASSDTALSIYTVEEGKVYAGGQAVNGEAKVTTATTTEMANIELDTTYGTANLNTGDSGEGYYVDIPMWIRSSNLEARDVKAWVQITDPTATADEKNGSDLINAVRVALIPVASTQDLSTVGTGLDYTKTAEWTVDGVATDSKATIFGLTEDTYNSKVLNAGGESATYSNSTGSSQDIKQAASTFKGNASEPTKFVPKYGEGASATDVPGVSIFKMPAATNDKYAAVLVVARIWIEGESTYCNDATANQDWNIDFHFELADATT
ncbi:MAG: hypothetical protein PUG48_05480 [Clostridia bacterium]|nr:hypothetical protein [Clostridia bacterium]